MSGFPPGAQAFLADLQANNSRDWFTESRARYDRDIKGPSETLAADLAEGLSGLVGEPMGAKLFRIQRDIRFSRDKSPYNTHIHIAFAPAGRGLERTIVGYYLALEPHRLMLGTGVFDLSGADLDAYRAAVDDGKQGARLAAILSETKDLRLDGAELKRVPAPYPADHARADLLRRKGLSLWRDVEDQALIASPALSDACLEAFATLAPLHLWLTQALAT